MGGRDTGRKDQCSAAGFDDETGPDSTAGAPPSIQFLITRISSSVSFFSPIGMVLSAMRRNRRLLDDEPFSSAGPFIPPLTMEDGVRRSSSPIFIVSPWH